MSVGLRNIIGDNFYSFYLYAHLLNESMREKKVVLKNRNEKDFTQRTQKETENRIVSKKWVCLSWSAKGQLFDIKGEKTQSKHKGPSEFLTDKTLRANTFFPATSIYLTMFKASSHTILSI